MITFVMVIFISNLLNMGIMMTHISSFSYPRVVNNTKGTDLANFLISLGIAIWAGVLVF